MATDSYSIHVAVDSTSAVTATRNLNGMEQATGRSERALLNLGNMAKVAGAALIGIGFKSAIQEMASFETKMLQLKSLTDATTQQMKAMEKQARELGATTAFSAQQSAEAQGVLASAGLKVNEILTATPKVLQLAAAGSLDLAKAAEIAVGTMKGLGLSLSDLGRINDVLAKTAADSSTNVQQIGDAMAQIAPIAQTFGISLETLSASLGILADNQLKGSEAGNNLKSMLVSLSRDTKENVDILEKHGVTYAQLNVETLGLAKVMKTLQDANLSGSESLKIFGADAAAAGNILASNAGKISEYTLGLEKAGGAADRAANILNQGLKVAFDALKGTLSEAALQLGEAGVTGALTDIIQQVTGVIAVYEGMGAKFAESNGYTKEQYENLKQIASGLETVAAGAGGIAVLTMGLWAANAAMIAFNIATRANPLMLVATAGAAGIGMVIDKINQQKKAHEEFMTSSNTLEEQNLKIKTQIAKVLSVTPNGTPNAAAKSMIDTEKENLRILIEQRTAIEAKTEAEKAQEQVTTAQTKAVKTNKSAVTGATTTKKDATAATKALAEAEANFNAQQDATIASSEIAGKILSGQSATQLLALTAERKAIEDKAKVSMASATEQATKNAITQQTQDALFLSLDKTRAIEAAIIAQSAATIDVKIAAAQAELDASNKYNMTLAEQLKLKSEIAGLQAEKGLIPEQMAQLDIKTQGSKDEIVSNAAAERIKAISDAQTAANERATAEMAILTANLDAAREAATGLADAFGAVGGSIGDMGIAFASYEKSQAAITDGLEQQLFTIAKMNDGKGDQAKKDKAISDAASKQDKLQVKSYGDMTKAAQGFFEKGSTGYKALGVATKVFRAFEMAQSAMSMVKMIADNAKKVGAFISGIWDSVSAVVASVLPTTTAEAAKSTAAGTTAVAAASAAPFPIGFATGAAMLAFMLAIGVAMSGSGSSAPTISGADYQKQQEEAYAASLGGTVLGSNEASNSIMDALDVISENSTADLDYSRGMAHNLESIASSLGVANAEISKRFNFSTSSAGLGTSGSSNIFSSSKTSREFAGTGIQFVAQTLGQIINEGVLKAKQYTDILITKSSSSFFGLFSSTSQSVQTIFSELDNSISSAIARTLIDTKQSIIAASELAGAGSEEIKLKLSDFLVDLGKLPLSTDATKNNEVLTAAMSKAADQMALLNPMFLEFQKTGEGYFQTLMRVTVLISTAQSKLKTLGIEAINYSDILVKSGDVEKQLIVQSIIASSKMEDLNTIMGMLPGTADDAISAFKDLVDIKQSLKDIGAASVLLGGNLIVTAGGISALKDSLATYFDNYFTDQEKLISKSETLSNSFAKLGLLMPIVNATFDSTTGVVTDAKANYKALLDVLKNDTTTRGKEIYVLALAMSQDFADAADLSAQLVKEKLAEQNKIIDTSYNRQIAIYKALGENEHALALEREKAMLGMDAATISYTKALNNLTDANTELANTEKSLETAYKGLVSMRDKFIGIGESLLAYYNELTGAKNPTASPEEIYNASKQAFTDASTLAAKGNAEALSSLPALGKAFLDSSKQYNATGEAYQADYKLVLKGLQDGMAVTKSQVDIMNAQLLEAKTANEKLATLDTSVNTVSTSITTLGTALAEFVIAQQKQQAAADDAKKQAEAAGAAGAAAAPFSNAAIKSFVDANINNPQAIADAAKKYGISNTRISEATGYSITQVNDYLKNAQADPAIQAAKDLATKNQAAEAARLAAEQAAAEAARTKAAQERAALLTGYRSNVPTTIAPGGTNNPYWESVIGQYDSWSKATYGTGMNRGWGADRDAINAYGRLKDQYLASIPAYAMGGMANGLSLVGEQGAELVNFGSPANVTNHSATNGLFDDISKSIKDSSEVQATLLKEQVVELQALVNLQSNANVAMINELKGMKAEISELTRKAKLEASS